MTWTHGAVFHTTWFQHSSPTYISGSLTKKNHDSGWTSTQTLSWGSAFSLNPQRFPMKNLNKPQWNPIFLWVPQLASVMQPSYWPLIASVLKESMTVPGIVWILTSNLHFTPSVVPSSTKLYQLYPLDSTSNQLKNITTYCWSEIVWVNFPISFKIWHFYRIFSSLWVSTGHAAMVNHGISLVKEDPQLPVKKVGLLKCRTVWE